MMAEARQPAGDTRRTRVRKNNVVHFHKVHRRAVLGRTDTPENDTACHRGTLSELGTPTRRDRGAGRRAKEGEREEEGLK